jgi:hypothetical protein
VLSFQGANASFSFHGTGVYLYGNNTLNSTGRVYAVAINNSYDYPLPKSIDNLLFSKKDLPYGEHQITLTNMDSQNLLVFNNALIFTGDGNDR